MKRRPLTEEEVHEMWRNVGRCVWQLQLVENALNISILIKHFVGERESMDTKLAMARLAELKSNTLGRSIGFAKANSLFDVALTERLTKFLGERNWLIHKSGDATGREMFTLRGRSEIDRRLTTFFQEAQAIQTLLVVDLVAYAQSKGVDTGLLHANARKTIAALHKQA